MLGSTELTGQVAVATGAGRGIGAAIARSFAAAGADLIIADLDQDSSQNTAEPVSIIGRKARAVKTNVGVVQEVSQLFEIVRS